MDVIPAIAPDGLDQPLRIPDRKLEEWIRTHPRGHIALATRFNKESEGRFVPLVKMTKWWHRYQFRDIERPKPKGFTLECLVGMHMNFNADSYAEAFISVLEGIQRTYYRLDQLEDLPDPALAGGTMPTGLTQAEFDAFMETVDESLELARQALDADTIAESVEFWRQVLGPKFPSPPNKEGGSRIVQLGTASTGAKKGPRPLKDQPFF